MVAGAQCDGTQIVILWRLRKWDLGKRGCKRGASKPLSVCSFFLHSPSLLVEGLRGGWMDEQDAFGVKIKTSITTFGMISEAIWHLDWSSNCNNRGLWHRMMRETSESTQNLIRFLCDFWHVEMAEAIFILLVPIASLYNLLVSTSQTSSSHPSLPPAQCFNTISHEK